MGGVFTGMKTALVLFVLLFTLIAGVEGQQAEFDLLIRNGRILDGTGNPSFVNDVGLRDGKIAAIGVLANARAARVIDANGLAVAPGFIDIHNHSDDTVLEDGDAQSMIRQGVTSMILGEGGSAAPSEAWKDFSSYFAELKRRGVSTNIGSYIGSSTVWTTVHGAKAGPASADELNRMRAVVREAMEQGALGVASSLSGPPGVWIDTDTLVAMCEVAAPYGGIYSTHIRTEGEGVFKAVSEAMEIGRRARVPVDVIHLKIAEHKLWSKILNGIPGSDWYNHYTATGGWEGMLLVTLRNPKYEQFEGKRMSEVIKAVGKPPLDVLFELLTDNDGSVPTVYFHHAEEDMRYALKQPFVSIGSD